MYIGYTHTPTFNQPQYYNGTILLHVYIHGHAHINVDCWVNEMEKLSNIAETQPHAAYAAYTHGLSSKWNYLLRITDWQENQLDDILASLEKSIQSRLFLHLQGNLHQGYIHERCWHYQQDSVVWA